MILRSYRLRVSLLLAALLLAQPKPAHAGAIISGTQIVLIFVGVGAVGAGIGVTVYHFAHKSPSLTGCTASTSGALTLENESDHHNFSLVGDTSDVKAGERVRVTGRKRNKDGVSTFIVEKLRKDYGACPATPAGGPLQGTSPSQISLRPPPASGMTWTTPAFNPSTAID